MEDELSYLKVQENSSAVVCILSPFGIICGKLC